MKRANLFSVSSMLFSGTRPDGWKIRVRRLTYAARSVFVREQVICAYAYAFVGDIYICLKWRCV